MAITKTPPSSLGLKVVTSNVSTIVLEFLSMEKRQFMQQVCKKWYYIFVPQLVATMPINLVPASHRTFKLFTEYDSKRYYLGAMRIIDRDLREDPGPTTFVSAGTTQEHRSTTWKLDDEGRICIVSTLDSAKLPKEESMLAAHRTFKMDIRGACETYAIITIFKAHEGFWKL